LVLSVAKPNGPHSGQLLSANTVLLGFATLSTNLHLLSTNLHLLYSR